GVKHPDCPQLYLSEPCLGISFGLDHGVRWLASLDFRSLVGQEPVSAQGQTGTKRRADPRSHLEWMACPLGSLTSSPMIASTLPATENLVLRPTRPTAQRVQVQYIRDTSGSEHR